MMVDLITPEPGRKRRLVASSPRRLGGSPTGEDVVAAEVPRLEMLIHAPRLETMAIAEDGLPVWISAADPRWWAAHKLWLAEQDSRSPIKRGRDLAQGRAVAEVLANHWEGLDLSVEATSSIPASLRDRLREEVEFAKERHVNTW
jgi:hypothetical protein